MRNSNLYSKCIVLTFALAIALLFSAASYPGFMSFDSVEALRQAREGIEGSQYPPFGSYVWRILDWIWPGPTLMQFFQNCTLLMSFAWILNNIGWPWFLRLVILTLFALMPPIAGTMLVVWKDIAVAAFYMLSFALIFDASKRKTGSKKFGLLFASILFIFCGMAYRFNAASGAYAILIYFFCSRGFYEGADGIRVVRSFCLAMLAVIILFIFVWIINSFSFPKFIKLEKNTNMMSVMRYDLVGISAMSGVSFLNDVSGHPIEVQYLKQIYDPRHLNITSNNDAEARIATDVGGLTQRWLNAVKDQPLAYLRHRLAVFSELIGLHKHEIFYVTHPNVDKNKFGIIQSPNVLTDIFVHYVVSFKESDLDRAWMYYLFGMFALVSTIFRKENRYRLEASVALGSAFLYILPMYFIAPAADLRYNFWSLCATLISVLFIAAGHIRFSTLINEGAAVRDND